MVVGGDLPPVAGRIGAGGQEDAPAEERKQQQFRFVKKLIFDQ